LTAKKEKNSPLQPLCGCWLSWRLAWLLLAGWCDDWLGYCGVAVFRNCGGYGGGGDDLLF